MASLDIGQTDITDVGSADYNDSVYFGDGDDYDFQWKIESTNTDGSGSYYSNDFPKWNHVYKKTRYGAIIDKFAIWVVGKKITLKGPKEKQNRFKRFVGFGKDSLLDIIYNQAKVAFFNGDSFAEIIRDKKGREINLKPLAPNSITIHTNDLGWIISYEHTRTGQIIQKENMLHLIWNRTADEIHGTSDFERIEDYIKTDKEMRNLMRVIFRRYVKPLIISSVDSDDPTEVANFKKKLDNAFKKGENLVIPKGTVDLDKISIPQYSTLDPMPWLINMQKDETRTTGLPAVIQGAPAKEDSEATAKIVYLAFEQVIKFRQAWLSNALETQLGITFEFEKPASLEDDLQTDNRKDGKLNKPINTNPAKHE